MLWGCKLVNKYLEILLWSLWHIHRPESADITYLTPVKQHWTLNSRQNLLWLCSISVRLCRRIMHACKNILDPRRQEDKCQRIWCYFWWHNSLSRGWWTSMYDSLLGLKMTVLYFILYVIERRSGRGQLTSCIEGQKKSGQSCSFYWDWQTIRNWSQSPPKS